MTATGELHIHTDRAALALAAARRWEAVARDAIAARGQCQVALAGGSTPRTLYRLLATENWRSHIDWGATRLWFGDERCVPPDHPDSNYRMVCESLLDGVPIAPEHVQRIEAERAPDDAAQAYGALLQARFAPPPGSAPRFDLVLLGLGPDGHIASLFPGTPLLDEDRHWVGACMIPRLDAWRISLTFPVLNAARHVLLLVAGEDKAEIVGSVFGDNRGEPAHEPFPVERLRPQGRIEWLLDQAAAARITPRAGATR
jgi:6-phosphogluconolactonase